MAWAGEHGAAADARADVYGSTCALLISGDGLLQPFCLSQQFSKQPRGLASYMEDLRTRRSRLLLVLLTP